MCRSYADRSTSRDGHAYADQYGDQYGHEYADRNADRRGHLANDLANDHTDAAAGHATCQGSTADLLSQRAKVREAVP